MAHTCGVIVFELPPQFSMARRYPDANGWNHQQKKRRNDFVEDESFKEHEKPSADALIPIKKSKKRTISIAVSSTILDNLKGEGSKHRVIAQIARAAAIFRVNEVVIIDDSTKNAGFDTSKDANLFRLVMEYLECPQYLRKPLFPMCLELKHIGVAPPLDASHHVRMDEDVPFREGIVTSVFGGTSKVNVGLENDITVDQKLEQGQRITVRMENKEVVGYDVPRTELGLYWGYTIRVAKKLSQVIAECPYEDGYDVTIGTSERGTDAAEVETLKYKHLLIVFGGPKGIEHALEQDEDLKEIDEPSKLFDMYLNTCPRQGSRTIRTEEAVLITLATLNRLFW